MTSRIETKDETKEPAATAGAATPRDEERWRSQAARETWWRPMHESWPYPTTAAFTDDRTDAEWLAQAFREAVGRVHDYGLKDPEDGLVALVRRSADAGDVEAADVLSRNKPHRHSEDPDYDCPHPFCDRWWPMVRAAEARARLAALTSSTPEKP